MWLNWVEVRMGGSNMCLGGDILNIILYCTYIHLQYYQTNPFIQIPRQESFCPQRVTSENKLKMNQDMYYT